MKYLSVGAAALALSALAMPAEAQAVRVDASIRLSDDVRVGVQYGPRYYHRPYGYRVYRPYPRYRVVRPHGIRPHPRYHGHPRVHAHGPPRGRHLRGAVIIVDRDHPRHDRGRHKGHRKGRGHRGHR